MLVLRLILGYALKHSSESEWFSVINKGNYWQRQIRGPGGWPPVDQRGWQAGEGRTGGYRCRTVVSPAFTRG